MNFKVMENKVLDEFIHKEKETFEETVDESSSSLSSEIVEDSNKKLLRFDEKTKTDDKKPKPFT